MYSRRSPKATEALTSEVEYDDTGQLKINRDQINLTVYSRLIKKRYTSPGGTARRKVHETKYWIKRPEKGAPNGLLLANTEEYGNIPSRPSS